MEQVAGYLPVVRSGVRRRDQINLLHPELLDAVAKEAKFDKPLASKYTRPSRRLTSKAYLRQIEGLKKKGIPTKISQASVASIRDGLHEFELGPGGGRDQTLDVLREGGTCC